MLICDKGSTELSEPSCRTVSNESLIVGQACTMSVSIVRVKQGRLKGIAVKNVDGGEYLAFRGIPYAAPPIGDLRFKDPRPPQAWSGVRDAGSFSPKATQFDFVVGLTTGSEDCLYLNVATNSLNGKRPVVMWIPGGGFLVGSADNDLYGPDYLLKRDVVFVSITFRLGCFGFLNLDLPDAAGNQGLKDLVAGLRWIRENIQAFGGDPDNVTIFGESAGAAAVHLLALSPLAQGLFHKVIAISGVAKNRWVINADPVKSALKFAETANIKTNDREGALRQLMTLSTTELIESQRKMGCATLAYKLMLHFSPSVDRSSDEPFMPYSPTEPTTNCAVNVPLLLGFMSDEGILLTMSPTVLSFNSINEDFAAEIASDLRISKPENVERLASVAQSVRKFYFDEGPITLEKDKPAYAKLKGDTQFVNGIQQIIDIQSAKNSPTYLFRFSYRPSYPTMSSIFKTDIEGTCHSDILGALFHSKFLMGNNPHQKGTTDRLVMKRLTRMLANFAKTGDPTPELDEIIPCKWEPVTRDKRNYLEINEELEPGVNPGESPWLFWKPILESLQLGVNI